MMTVSPMATIINDMLPPAPIKKYVLHMIIVMRDMNESRQSVIDMYDRFLSAVLCCFLCAAVVEA
jgi:hypothetical protein